MTGGIEIYGKKFNVLKFSSGASSWDMPWIDRLWMAYQAKLKYDAAITIQKYARMWLNKRSARSGE